MQNKSCGLEAANDNSRSHRIVTQLQFSGLKK